MKLELPAEMQVESLLAPVKSDQKAAYYERSTVKDGNGLKLSRTLRLSGYLFEAKQYPSLQAFYDRVLNCDSQQITVVARADKAPK